MFRLDLVILRPILTFVLPDTVHTLGSHRVYIRCFKAKVSDPVFVFVAKVVF